jgi:very-short-patch-repair endonuclease
MQTLDIIDLIEKNPITNNDKLLFNKNLEELLFLFNTQKVNLVNFLKNNFKENIHYIIDKNINLSTKHCGHNKINYLVNNETFELIKNSYNLRYRYVNVINNTKNINIIMSLENQTIGFIENSFKNVIEVIRQFRFKNYYVDLYFPKYNLVVECDERNHIDRNIINEKNRENYILSLNNSIIRFNPNDKLFDLSIVLKNINIFLFSKEVIESTVIKI